MRFVHPELATWLLALPLAVAWWTFRRYGRLGFLRDAALGPRAQAASRLSSTRGDLLALGLAVLTFTALVAAAMRPQLLVAWRLPEFERRDLVIGLDRSVSMRATDIEPTRFARAVSEIKQFLEEKPAEIDRVALVSFSNAAIAVSHYLARRRAIDWDLAARRLQPVLAMLLARPLEAGHFWNVNLPDPPYAMAQWAGKSEDDFVGLYYIPFQQGGQWGMIYYPA